MKNKNTPRRASGFIRAGDSDLSATGLSGKRVRDLQLHRAWRRVAGEDLAGRVRPVRVVGGCLELECPDDRWTAALAGMIPELAGGVARLEPALGIRTFRVLGQGGDPEPVPLQGCC